MTSGTFTFQVTVDVVGTGNLCHAQLLLADTLAQISNRYNIEDPNETHRLSPIRAELVEILDIALDAIGEAMDAGITMGGISPDTFQRGRVLLADIAKGE